MSTDTPHTIEKPGDAIIIRAGGRKVYVWWQRRNNVRVTIFASEPGYSRMFNVGADDIEEDSA